MSCRGHVSPSELRSVSPLFLPRLLGLPPPAMCPGPPFRRCLQCRRRCRRLGSPVAHNPSMLADTFGEAYDNGVQAAKDALLLDLVLLLHGLPLQLGRILLCTREPFGTHPPSRLHEQHGLVVPLQICDQKDAKHSQRKRPARLIRPAMAAAGGCCGGGGSPASAFPRVKCSFASFGCSSTACLNSTTCIVMQPDPVQSAVMTLCNENGKAGLAAAAEHREG